MKTRVKMLKVKIKSLAAEAQIIRLEEKRSKPGSQQQCELHQHRVTDVRSEQRCALLAYAFLRGIPRNRCEAASKKQPDWDRVAKLVEKFGTAAWDKAAKQEQAARFADWKLGFEVAAAS